MIIQQSNRRYGLPRLLTSAPQIQTEAAIPASNAMNSPNSNESMVQTLEATGNYRVLRRLIPRTIEPAITGHRIGMIVDFETTGLDTSSDEVIEIAAVKFSYADDRIISIVGTLQAFQQPSAPIPPEITALTGITDAMVEGQKIDGAQVEQFVADVRITIAHFAEFVASRRKMWTAIEHDFLCSRSVSQSCASAPQPGRFCSVFNCGQRAGWGGRDRPQKRVPNLLRSFKAPEQI